MAEALSKLLPQGLRVKAQQVRMRLGLDDPEDGDEVLGGGSRPDDPDDPLPPAMVRAIARAAAGGRRSGDSIDAAIEDMLAGTGWEPMMDPVIEPILEEAAAALGRGDSLESFRAQLPEMFASMDDAMLIQILRRMSFSAVLSGDAGLEAAP